MANLHITESETQTALEALNPNKGVEPDGLFHKVLKTLSYFIAPTLSHFYLSLQTSQVPDDWRLANVTKVAKESHTADTNLFRL